MYPAWAENLVKALMLAVSLRAAVWIFKDIKRDKQAALEQLRKQRSKEREAEMRAIGRRITAELERERTFTKAKENPVTCNKPLRKATGLYSNADAQDLLK